MAIFEMLFTPRGKSVQCSRYALRHVDEHEVTDTTMILEAWMSDDPAFVALVTEPLTMRTDRIGRSRIMAEVGDLLGMAVSPTIRPTPAEKAIERPPVRKPEV